MATIYVNSTPFSQALGAPLSQALQTLPGFEMPCAGNGRCGKCKVIVSGQLSPLTTAEKETLTPEEIAQGVRLACQARIQGDCQVTLPEKGQSRICLTGVMAPMTLRPRFSQFGAAVDIGTTTLAARLYDRSGQLLAQVSTVNPQASWGADVISRIEAALGGQASALAQAIRQAVDGLLAQLAQDAGLSVQAIDALVVTGNTAMLYLLTQTSPDCLSHAPFLAEDLFGRVYSGAQLGLHNGSDASVYLPRCMSAFVGADITTALLASGICKGTETRLLVDIGTNGEMALWHDGALYCCSTAAGPAFEGAGLSMGMQGKDGAVDHVTVQDGQLLPHVIGDAAPRGICGSGVIDALACLLELETLDETGLLDEDPTPIAPPVSLTQKDVRMVQLAKSAIHAGLLTLLKTQALPCSQVAELAVAGGFGSYLDVENAGHIGLIPPELVPKVRVLGNAALSGAAMLLLDRDLAQVSDRLAQSAQTLTLSANPVFTDFYTEGMLF